MAARDRMAAVSGATLSLLRDAYQRRDKVAVITFRGDSAAVLLPPTSSVHIASRRLARFDTGGKTPLAQGLLAARAMVARERVREPGPPQPCCHTHRRPGDRRPRSGRQSRGGSGAAPRRRGGLGRRRLRNILGAFGIG